MVTGSVDRIWTNERLELNGDVLVGEITSRISLEVRELHEVREGCTDGVRVDSWIEETTRDLASADRLKICDDTNSDKWVLRLERELVATSEVLVVQITNKSYSFIVSGSRGREYLV